VWLFHNRSFLSVVADRKDPTQLLVRARIAGDIEALFPTAQVSHTPEHDYAYRANVTRDEVATVIANELLSIDYYNFKSSVPDHRRHDAYTDVWSTMHRNYPNRYNS
jgi:hypothetical protein